MKTWRNPQQLADERRRQKRWHAKNPGVRTAWRAVRSAVDSGRICRRPCERCGETKRVNAHHEDHSDRLAVEWYCERCHAILHRAGKIGTGFRVITRYRMSLSPAIVAEAREAADVDLLNDALWWLTDRERDILVRRFAYGETLLSVAKSMGITKERVRQIQNAALELAATLPAG